MAPTRKSKSVSKWFANVNEVSPDEDGRNANKYEQRKRKLSDMLGSQWSKEELEHFYEAYRKYGKDWKKVAGIVRSRSTEMVEALYNMNRAYLSLPEGTASVVGLIAMMTDHYNVKEESDSERESNDGLGISRKPQKRGQGKFQLNNSKGLGGHFPDLLQSHSVASSYGCLSLLEKWHSGGTQPRAVGKRTPRFPVSYSNDKYDRETFVSLNKQGPTSEVDAIDNEVAHVVALALAEASHRGGYPQLSQSPNRRTEHMKPSTIQNERMHAQSEMTGVKLFGASINIDYPEGSLGSMEAENGDYSRDRNCLMDTEGAVSFEVQWKVKKFHKRKPKVKDIENSDFDDVKEGCSGTEAGLNLSAARGKIETEVTDSKFDLSSPHPRKRSKKLFFGDESSALDALQTLADISLMMPASTIESEPFVQLKEEERTFDIVDRSSVREAMFANHQRDKPKISGTEERGNQSSVAVKALKNSELGRNSSIDLSALSEAKQRINQSTNKMQKRKFKSLASKLQIPKAKTHSNSHLSEPQKTEASAEEGNNYISKGTYTSQIAPLPEQGKSVSPPEHSSSSTDQRRAGNNLAVSTLQVSTVNQVNLPTKLRNRRKMVLQKPLIRKELSPDNLEKLSYVLSSYLVRRWCYFEWFYSAIDYPWFAKREFVEYLNHVGLGHVPRLTRVEWGVIRSSLGKPRRLSEKFLHEEKEKLNQYRESVRTHYTELRAGIRDGLPTDLARPLSVGQRVIALHPKTREIHDGSILTVDCNCFKVQFDRSELGVEFVRDIDCMPLNPLENMPEALKRENVAVGKFCENFNEPKVDGQSKSWITRGYMKVVPSENLENVDGPTPISLLTYPMNTSLKQAKEDTIRTISRAKAATSEVVNEQQAAYTQPCTFTQIQAREADIRALCDLTRALDKQEALVLELKHMSDDVLETQKDGDNSLKDSKPFKMQCATILLQLKKADEQVSSALFNLRQRNTYQGDSPVRWLKHMGSSGNPGSLPSSFGHSVFHAQEIVESLRLKAQKMVDASIQAMSTLKEGEDAFARIDEALDSINNLHFRADSGMSKMRSLTPQDPVHDNLAYHEQSTSGKLGSMMTGHAPGLKLNNASDGNEAHIPSELISSCVATLLMIQTCTKQQFSPAEVAQILDSATRSLQPSCSQNLPIYREIQMCMGFIKTRISAPVPI